MKYKQLGQTGLYVSELTLGTMTFDTEGGSYAGLIGATGQDLATRMVDLSIEAGINIFDTPMSTAPASRKRCWARRLARGGRTC